MIVQIVSFSVLALFMVALFLSLSLSRNSIFTLLLLLLSAFSRPHLVDTLRIRWPKARLIPGSACPVAHTFHLGEMTCFVVVDLSYEWNDDCENLTRIVNWLSSSFTILQFLHIKLVLINGILLWKSSQQNMGNKPKTMCVWWNVWDQEKSALIDMNKVKHWITDHKLFHHSQLLLLLWLIYESNLMKIMIIIILLLIQINIIKIYSNFEFIRCINNVWIKFLS